MQYQKSKAEEGEVRNTKVLKHAYLCMSYHDFYKESGRLTLVSLSKAALAELIPPPYLHIMQIKTLSTTF